MARRARNRKNRPVGETRRILLQVLNSTSMAARELAQRLDINVSTVRPHLQALIEWGFVSERKKRIPSSLNKGKVKVFSITERGW